MKDDPGILIPLDGSETATVALGAAQAIAKNTGAVLHIIHVSEESEKPVPEKELLRNLRVDKLLELNNYVLHQVTGDIVEQITGLATGSDIGMIVMASHGHSHDARNLMGHITMGIIQSSPDPVMVIRPDMENVPTSRWRPSKMLVPLNGSPLAAAAMDGILKLAAEMGCDVDVVHIAVLGEEPPAEAGTLVTPRYMDYPQHDWSAWAREFLQRFTRRVEEVNMRLFHREGVPAVEMLKLAEEGHDEIIVLTWRGRLEGDRARTIKEILGKTQVPVVLINAG